MMSIYLVGHHGFQTKAPFGCLGQVKPSCYIGRESASCRISGAKGNSVSDLAKAVRDTDESVCRLGEGLIYLTSQQEVQVSLLRSILDRVNEMTGVLSAVHEAVTAPAPPSPIAEALTKLSKAVDANTAAVERIERMLAERR